MDASYRPLDIINKSKREIVRKYVGLGSPIESIKALFDTLIKLYRTGRWKPSDDIMTRTNLYLDEWTGEMSEDDDDFEDYEDRLSFQKYTLIKDDEDFYSDDEQEWPGMRVTI